MTCGNAHWKDHRVSLLGRQWLYHRLGLLRMDFLDELGKAVCIKIGDRIRMKESLLPMLSSSLFEQDPESKSCHVLKMNEK